MLNDYYENEDSTEIKTKLISIFIFDWRWLTNNEQHLNKTTNGFWMFYDG
jgi:hypothetical protein